MEVKRLFVGNLNSDINGEKLAAAFAPFGTVTEAMVIRDHEGASRRFGFVEMASAEEAGAARAALDGSMLDGSVLRIDEARPPKVLNFKL